MLGFRSMSVGSDGRDTVAVIVMGFVVRSTDTSYLTHGKSKHMNGGQFPFVAEHPQSPTEGFIPIAGPGKESMKNCCSAARPPLMRISTVRPVKGKPLRFSATNHQVLGDHLTAK